MPTPSGTGQDPSLPAGRHRPPFAGHSAPAVSPLSNGPVTRVKLRSHGLTWEVLPGDKAALDRTDGFRRGRDEDILRELPGRRVVCLTDPSGTPYIVKSLTPKTLFDRIRATLLPSPARLERDRAIAAAERGLPVASPLALGESTGPARKSVLVLEYLPGSPLDRAFEAMAPTDPGRKSFMESLALFLHDVHDRGMTHRDLHPGNIWVRHGGDRRFALLDLHSARLRRAVSTRERLRALVQLNLYFFRKASRAERLRFLRAYLGDQVSSPGRKQIARRLERATEKAARRYWDRISRRCTAENKYFRRWRHGRWRGFRKRSASWPAEGADPVRPFANRDATVLKDSEGALSVLWRQGGETVFGKHYHPTGFFGTIKDLFRTARALKIWRRAWALEVRGLPSPRPIMAASHRLFGIPRGSVYFTEGLEGVLCLDRFARSRLEAGLSGQSELRGLVARLGTVVGGLHRHGFSHRDLKAGNILVGGAPPDIHLTDLEGLRYHGRLSEKRREKDLARLLRTAREDCGLSRAHWVRLLKAYLPAANLPPQLLKDLARRINRRADAGRRNTL